MKTIVLGKDKPTTCDPQRGEVYQPFSHKPSQTGVSRKHATITIDDNGYWWLEDRWSTNGTYIRKDNGNFRKIGDREYPGKCRITPMTFVKLGIEDATGCCFYAKQADLYGNFNEEFEFIQNKIETITNEGEKRLKMLKIAKMVLRILPGLIAFSWYLFDKSPNGIFIKMLIPIIANPLVEFMYNTNEKKKEIEKQIKEQKRRFAQCPNPECNHLLSDTDIQLMRCETCKIKHN
jgi:hypothetical protein